VSDGTETGRLAASLLARGKLDEAERQYRQLLGQTWAVEEQYDEWLNALARIYQGLGRPREAGHVLCYLQRFAEAAPLFAGAGAVADAARCRELWARSGAASSPLGPNAALELLAQAAAGYAAAGWNVHAAVAWAHARAFSSARQAWEKVARDPRLADRPYEQALCHFNLGLAARAGSAPDAARHLILAQQQLEEVADRFEAEGQRERAWDCYSVLIQLGREEDSFENLAEGYLNCIRVLKEDNLKYYALQYYEDFLRLALGREEFHAAATLFREAADYARRVGLEYERGYLQRAAETWWLAADKNEREGGPVELSENALHAAIDGFSALGDFLRVRQSYLRLGALDLPEKKQQRYREAARRYPDQSGAPVKAPAFPDYLRHQHAYPPIWELDLVEWELDGDHAAVCASILGDAHQPGMIRRQALALLLVHLDGARSGEAASRSPARLAEIAQGLGELAIYQTLRPLERLYAEGAPLVRRGVMKALPRLFFKRTFALLVRGLRDAAPEVRDAAVEALEALHFPHAFDPLTRIFREHADHAVKVTALTSIGRIATVEAGEFLIDVLRYESEGLREVARQLLSQFEHREAIYPLLRRHLEMETGPARIPLEQLVRSYGLHSISV
jgi:hypothetical protein